MINKKYEPTRINYKSENFLPRNYHLTLSIPKSVPIQTQKNKTLFIKFLKKGQLIPH